MRLAKSREIAKLDNHKIIKIANLNANFNFKSVWTQTTRSALETVLENSLAVETVR